MEFTAPVQPLLSTLAPLCNTWHLFSQSSHLQAPAQFPLLPISATPDVKYVESTPALSGVAVPAVEGHRCSACRVDLASARGPVSGSPASVVEYIDAASVVSDLSASMVEHIEPAPALSSAQEPALDCIDASLTVSISAAVNYSKPAPARVRTSTCSGMKKNLKSIPNSRKFLTKQKTKSKPNRRVIDEMN